MINLNLLPMRVKKIFFYNFIVFLKVACAYNKVCTEEEVTCLQDQFELNILPIHNTKARSSVAL